jgi:CDP-glucose 4,6-dehydratase
LLNLVTDKAFHSLKWQPVWDFRQTLKETVTWYYQAAQISPSNYEGFQALTRGQIELYQADTFN